MRGPAETLMYTSGGSNFTVASRLGSNPGWGLEGGAVEDTSCE